MFDMAGLIGAGTLSYETNGAFSIAKQRAASIPPRQIGTYSQEMFTEDFPQFFHAGKSLIPENVLKMFIEQANNSIIPGRWGKMWRYCAGLYVAHFAALYAMTYTESENSTLSTLAASSGANGVISKATMGDTTVEYDTSAATSGTQSWGVWNDTKYGQQLIAYARMLGGGGIVVI